MNYPSPCDSCTTAVCPDKRCERWRIRYLWRQKRINAKAKQLVGSVRVKQNAWVYMHPDEYRRYLEKDPCEGCICEKLCDRPCPRRMAWWEEKMEVVRRRCGRELR